MFQVFEVTSPTELQDYRLSWQELWQRGRQRRFQMSIEWLLAYWKTQPQDRELKVLVATLGNKVIGILPLVIKPVETRIGILRVLTYPLDGFGNWYGPIGPNSAATLAAGLRYLSKEREGWDLLDLTYTDRDRIDLGRSSTALRNVGWKPLERIWQQIPVVETRGNWRNFLDCKRPEIQAAIQAAENDCSTRGSVTHEVYRSDALAQSSLPEMLDSCESMTDPGADISQRRYLIEAADHQDVLQLHLMRISGQPVAAAICFQHAGCLEVARLLCQPGAPKEQAAVVAVLLQQVLMQAHVDEQTLVEINVAGPNQAANLNAAKLWMTDLLVSYRYTSCPLTNVRASLLVNYHSFSSPKLQRSRFKPRQALMVDAPTSRNSTNPEVSDKESSRTIPTKSKQFGQPRLRVVGGESKS